MIDGRNVSDPLFGGIFWDVEDFPLEDVERIEVIRGSGGTLWGDNAVNGLINLYQEAADTQGLSVVTSYGLDQEQTASVQYGGKIGQNLSYRVFGKSLLLGSIGSSFRRELVRRVVSLPGRVSHRRPADGKG